MPIVTVSFLTGLLSKLESLGGEIQYSTADYDGSLIIRVNHPDVTIRRRTGDDTVEIRCRKGMFPPTRAHVDVDDIMTVIEGWMKEAGSKCGKAKLMTPTPESKAFESMFAKDEVIERHEEALDARERLQRSNERAAELKRRRQEWGVDKLPPRRTARPRNKSIRDFIREHRDELDAAIRRQNPKARIDDDERRLWILNDEGLYNWARSEGVKL